MTVIWGGAVNRELEEVTLSVNGESYTVQRVVRDDSVLLPPRESAGAAISDREAIEDIGDMARHQINMRKERAKTGARTLQRSEEQRLAMLAAVKGGMTPCAAARAFGMSVSGVRGLIARRGGQ